MVITLHQIEAGCLSKDRKFGLLSAQFQVSYCSKSNHKKRITKSSGRKFKTQKGTNKKLNKKEMPRKKIPRAGIKKSAEEIPKRDSNAGKALFESKKNDGRKYKHRTVESNWAKYEDESDPTQAKSQTGALFDTLVTHSGKDVSTFQLKDDLFLEPERLIDLQNHQNKKKGVLGLDLEEVSKHLSNISIFMKLRLQNVFGSLDNDGCNWHGDYFQHLMSEIEVSNVALQKKKPCPLLELQWNFSSYKNYEKDIKSLVTRIKEISMNKEAVDNKELENMKENTKNINNYLKERNITMMDESCKLPKDEKDDDNENDDDGNDNNRNDDEDQNDDDDDDELESLLSGKPMSFQSKTTLTESFMSNKDENLKTLVADVTETEEENKVSCEENGNKPTESLEEWLDSILD